MTEPAQFVSILLQKPRAGEVAARGAGAPLWEDPAASGIL
jgi:hypothetical protein